VNERTLLRLLSAGRILIGVAFVAAPARGAAGWIGRDAEHAGTQVMARAFGGRDIALGAATLATVGSRGPLLPLVLGGVLADATDAAGTLAAGDRIPAAARRTAAAVAVGAALTGAWIATRLD
jgi:hypothetical protein